MVLLLWFQIRELENQLADKIAKNDVEGDLVKKMESDGRAIAMELEKQKQSVASSRNFLITAPPYPI